MMCETSQFDVYISHNQNEAITIVAPLKAKLEQYSVRVASTGDLMKFKCKTESCLAETSEVCKIARNCLQHVSLVVIIASKTYGKRDSVPLPSHDELRLIVHSCKPVVVIQTCRHFKYRQTQERLQITMPIQKLFIRNDKLEVTAISSIASVIVDHVCQIYYRRLKQNNGNKNDIQDTVCQNKQAGGMHECHITNIPSHYPSSSSRFSLDSGIIDLKDIPPQFKASQKQNLLIDQSRSSSSSSSDSIRLGSNHCNFSTTQPLQTDFSKTIACAHGSCVKVMIRVLERHDSKLEIDSISSILEALCFCFDVLSDLQRQMISSIDPQKSNECSLTLQSSVLETGITESSVKQKYMKSTECFEDHICSQRSSGCKLIEQSLLFKVIGLAIKLMTQWNDSELVHKYCCCIISRCLQLLKIGAFAEDPLFFKRRQSNIEGHHPLSSSFQSPEFPNTISPITNSAISTHKKDGFQIRRLFIEATESTQSPKVCVQQKPTYNKKPHFSIIVEAVHRAMTKFQTCCEIQKYCLESFSRLLRLARKQRPTINWIACNLGCIMRSMQAFRSHEDIIIAGCDVIQFIACQKGRKNTSTKPACNQREALGTIEETAHMNIGKYSSTTSSPTKSGKVYDNLVQVTLQAIMEMQENDRVARSAYYALEALFVHCGDKISADCKIMATETILSTMHQHSTKASVHLACSRALQPLICYQKI